LITLTALVDSTIPIFTIRSSMMTGIMAFIHHGIQDITE